MSIFKQAVIASAAMAALGTQAFAGDLNAPETESEPVAMAPMPVPPPAPATGDWTGGYAGAVLSYGDVGSDPSGVDGDGGLFGVRAGYDYDFGNFVLGGSIGHDFSDIDLGGSDSLDGLTTLKLRAGYDLGDTLVFASGGWARADATVGGVEDDDNGYVLGVGAEYRFTPRTSLTGELDYHRFDDFGGTGTDLEATTLKAGVNFRF